jgi:enoyl-CoA hydratase/carnithine racemase
MSDTTGSSGSTDLTILTDFSSRITLETRGHVLLMGLRRAEKRNAFDLAMLRGLAEAFTRYDDDPELRCALLFGHGEHFTAGLDLAEVGPAVAGGEPLFPAGGRRPARPVRSRAPQAPWWSRCRAGA